MSSSTSLPLEHNGRTHYVHELTQAMRNRFSAWMKSHAIQETMSLRAQLPGDVFRDLMSSLRDDIAIKKLYEFGGEKYVDMVSTEDGAREFARLVLNDPTLLDSEIDTLMEAKGQEFDELFRTVNTKPDAPTQGKA